METWTGEALAEIRKAHGLRQRDIAKAAGMSRSRVSLIEGARVVRQRTAERIIDAIVALSAPSA